MLVGVLLGQTRFPAAPTHTFGNSGGRFEKHEVVSAVRLFVLVDPLTTGRVCGYLYVVTLGAVAQYVERLLCK